MTYGTFKIANKMKTVLVTGIGGLTPLSITKIIRENHPDYHKY